jgi:hypothetical protein
MIIIIIIMLSSFERILILQCKQVGRSDLLIKTKRRAGVAASPTEMSRA